MKPITSIDSFLFSLFFLLWGYSTGVFSLPPISSGNSDPGGYICRTTVLPPPHHGTSLACFYATRMYPFFFPLKLVDSPRSELTHPRYALSGVGFLYYVWRCWHSERVSRTASEIARLPGGAFCCLLFLQLAVAAVLHVGTAACTTSVMLVRWCKSAAAAASVYFPNIRIQYLAIFRLRLCACRKAFDFDYCCISPTEILDTQKKNAQTLYQRF